VSVDGAPLPSWSPGAHIDLRLGDDMIRQYSLVPSEGGRPSWTVAVLIEQEGRGGSRLIDQNIHVDSIVKTSGPRNHFPFIEGSSYLFVAGGIGITPLIAMCRAAEAAGAQWRLAYLGRTRSRMAYLDAIEREFPERVSVYTTEEGVRFDVEADIAALPGDTLVYCCGPDRLMNAVEAAMSSPERLPFVHLEHFHPREAVQSENFEFTVYAAASDIEFVVPADESILMAADFEGVIVPGDCLEGTCGSCETRVLMGQVEHRDSILSPQERLTSDRMMICVSRARPGCTRLELDL
jgi:ferredoxin-NADP reductase